MAENKEVKKSELSEKELALLKQRLKRAKNIKNSRSYSEIRKDIKKQYGF